MNWQAFFCVLGGFSVLAAFVVLLSFAIGWAADTIGPEWTAGIMFGTFGLGAAVIAGMSE